MSYFTTEKKKVGEKTKAVEKIGPGAYETNKNKEPSKCYAPFGSLSRKVQSVKNKSLS